MERNKLPSKLFRFDNSQDNPANRSLVRGGHDGWQQTPTIARVVGVVSEFAGDGDKIIRQLKHSEIRPTTARLFARSSRLRPQRSLPEPIVGRLHNPPLILLPNPVLLAAIVDAVKSLRLSLSG